MAFLPWTKYGTLYDAVRSENTGIIGGVIEVAGMNSLLLSALIPDEEQAPSSLPSIFEMFLLEQTESLLKPALKHLLHAATGVSDSYSPGLDQSSSLVHKLFDYYDPLYVLLSLLVQHNALQEDATITEQMYGLRRISYSGPADALIVDAAPLSKQRRALSLALVALLPSVLEKLRTACRYRPLPAAPSSSSSSSIVARLTTLVQRTAPPLVRLAILGYDLSVVAQRLLYLFGRSSAAHPLLAVLGLSLVRRPAGQSAESSSSSSSAINYRVLVFIATLMSIRAANWLTGSEAQELIEQSGERQGGPALFVAPRRPDPPPLLPASRANPAMSDHNLCPLCQRQRRNPCASTGGFVFCYLCILNAVRSNPRCPVSGLPCGEKDLIRVFQEDKKDF